MCQTVCPGVDSALVGCGGVQGVTRCDWGFLQRQCRFISYTNAWPVTTLPSPSEHYSPPPLQAHKFLRAAPEWLRCSCWVTVHHQNLPRPWRIVRCCKKTSSVACGAGPAAQAPRVFPQRSSRWAGQGSRELRGVISGSTSAVQSWLPHRCWVQDYPTETPQEHDGQLPAIFGSPSHPVYAVTQGLGYCPPTFNLSLWVWGQPILCFFLSYQS